MTSVVHNNIQHSHPHTLKHRQMQPLTSLHSALIPPPQTEHHYFYFSITVDRFDRSVSSHVAAPDWDLFRSLSLLALCKLVQRLRKKQPW